MSPRNAKEIEVLTINKEDILPGETATVNISVGRLPSGTRINMPTHVFRSKNIGPTLLVLAGVHGDEINGIESVRRCVFNEYFDKLQCGSIIAIPLVNVYGFINFSRDVPDGKDVNRSFPGNLNGSLASRVARIITKKILPHVDYIIDIHTGGSSRYNFPQIRYSAESAKSLELAKVFGAPYILQKSVITGSLRKTARDMDIPTIVFEGGESLRFDGFSIDNATKGILRVSNHLGLTDKPVAKKNNMILFKKTTWLRASQAGLFLWSKCSGQKVQKGEPLGIINDPQGIRSVTVLSKRDGYIIGHNNASVVNQGDALFAIGHDYEAV